ncbi:N-formylglutamate deformylase [Fodinicurvata fenggangensis]|uniref:N-formylglutamate deformylase n=1 Tax=Fodinicurvata fenggangensis TaxID=1121830 RepID=UPI000690E15F|nr:N-formylglutamate deformylase [Fodinicurvata fenggangensis]
MTPVEVPPVEVTRGSSPVVLAFPHSGTEVPAEIFARLNERGQQLADTDWHVDRLYSGLLPNATQVMARFHRYVIDANRPPSGESLYPGQATTGLVPDIDFDGNPIWRDGEAPGDAEIAARREAFHKPYHEALTAELERLRAEHGFAVLYDCHSIRAWVPRLFEGRLPDFNIGTNQGASCAPILEQRVTEVCAAAEDYSHVLNGRFRGGWTTRHYGRPEEGLHAIQMELAQAAYLQAEEPPFAYDADKAEGLRRHLGRLLQVIETTALDGALTTNEAENG